MKATVNGIQIEGTAEEIHEYVEMNKKNNKITLNIGKRDYTSFLKDIEEEIDKANRKRNRIASTI